MTPPEWACERCGHIHDDDPACQSVLLGHALTCNCSQRSADRSAGMTTGDRDQQHCAVCGRSGLRTRVDGTLVSHMADPENGPLDDCPGSGYVGGVRHRPGDRDQQQAAEVRMRAGHNAVLHDELVTATLAAARAEEAARWREVADAAREVLVEVMQNVHMSRSLRVRIDNLRAVLGGDR